MGGYEPQQDAPAPLWYTRDDILVPDTGNILVGKTDKKKRTGFPTKREGFPRR